MTLLYRLNVIQHRQSADIKFHSQWSSPVRSSLWISWPQGAKASVSKDLMLLAACSDKAFAAAVSTNWSFLGNRQTSSSFGSFYLVPLKCLQRVKDKEWQTRNQLDQTTRVQNNPSLIGGGPNGIWKKFWYWKPMSCCPPGFGLIITRKGYLGCFSCCNAKTVPSANVLTIERLTFHPK